MTVSINLLPDDLRRRSIRSRTIRIWTPILLLVALAVTGVSQFHWARCAELEAAAVAGQADYETASDRMIAVMALEQQVNRLKSEIGELRQLQPAEDPLKMIHIVSPLVSEAGDQLAISGMDIVSDSGLRLPTDVNLPIPVSTTGNPSIVPRQKSNVQIRGTATSDLVIARFISGLRECGGFQSVTLKSSQPSNASTERVREFILECLREVSL